jgi:hypothetical protein
MAHGGRVGRRGAGRGSLRYFRGAAGQSRNRGNKRHGPSKEIPKWATHQDVKRLCPGPEHLTELLRCALAECVRRYQELPPVPSPRHCYRSLLARPALQEWYEHDIHPQDALDLDRRVRLVSKEELESYEQEAQE